MTPKHFSDRIRSCDLPKINYTKKLEKIKENCALPLLPRYAGTRSQTYGECEKHMYKIHTNCILCDQIGRSYLFIGEYNTHYIEKRAVRKRRFF